MNRVSIKIIIVILSAAIVLSYGCNNSSRYTTQIQGDWVFAKEILRENKSVFIINHDGFSLKAAGVCEYRPGFFCRYFENTLTKYQLQKDSLKIYNQCESKWLSYKIKIITGDTMSLQDDDGNTKIYTRKHYTINKEEIFDQVIVSNASEFFLLPEGNISISKKGAVLLKYMKDRSGYEFLVSKINNAIFSSIETDFKKASFMNLNNNYDAKGYDMGTVYVTFLRNGKIVKTIKDYGNASPLEFQWAYLYVRALKRQLKLDTVKNFPFWLNALYGAIHDQNKIYHIPMSEVFYLSTLLMYAQETKMPFKEKYKIRPYSFENSSVKITTDGRFFKFILKNGSSKSLDVGYDFIKENSLLRPDRLDK